MRWVQQTLAVGGLDNRDRERGGWGKRGDLRGGRVFKKKKEYFAIQDFAEEKTMKRKLDMDRIAEGLGTERRSKVSATVGYFGQMHLFAEFRCTVTVPT